MIRVLKNQLWYIYTKCRAKNYGQMTPTSSLRRGVKVYNKKNLFMAEHTNIDPGGVIMNTRARFVVKKNSGAAIGLTVITGGHMSSVGMIRRFITNKDKDVMDVNHELERDVIVEEDVWIASNVTLLKGAVIGRGSIVGSGSVVRTPVPPYSVVIGNPAKIVGFVFTPDEIIEHEEKLYPIDERIPREILEKNYEKYFLNRIKEIRSITKL